MPGGVIKYVPLQPPKHGATKTSTAADWTLDMKELEKVFSPKTKMIVRIKTSYLLDVAKRMFRRCSIRRMISNLPT